MSAADWIEVVGVFAPAFAVGCVLGNIAYHLLGSTRR